MILTRIRRYSISSDIVSGSGTARAKSIVMHFWMSTKGTSIEDDIASKVDHHNMIYDED